MTSAKTLFRKQKAGGTGAAAGERGDQQPGIRSGGERCRAARDVWSEVFQLAAIAGVEPWRYTLRELKWQADETLAQAWNHTAALSAMLANTVRDKKKRATPFLPADFNPVELARRHNEKSLKVPITALRDVFVDGQFPDTIQRRE